MSATPTSTFVIVGAGLAGAKAAETLRAEGFDGRLLLVWDVVQDIQALIRGGRPLDPARLADPDIPLDQVTGDRAGALATRSTR